MPVESSPRRVSDTENRLCILFCLHEVGMATPQQLWNFAGRHTQMDYISFCLLLGQLRSDGAVAFGSGALDNTLFLTDSGEKTMELFLHRIPHTVRLEIEQYAAAFTESLSRFRQVNAVSIPSPEGYFGTELNVCEEDIPTLRICLYSESREEILRAAASFPQKAPRVITMLYTIFPPEGITTDSISQVQSESEAWNLACPDCPSYFCWGGSRYGAVAALESKSVRMKILFQLDGPEAAASWAASADMAGSRLAGQILEMLTEEEKA